MEWMSRIETGENLPLIVALSTENPDWYVYSRDVKIVVSFDETFGRLLLVGLT
jgi:hypothetical protein